jgi:hypothetical protein
MKCFFNISYTLAYIFFYTKKRYSFIQIENTLIITNSRLLKTEKGESTNNLAAPRLIAYNGIMKVPTNMTK